MNLTAAQVEQGVKLMERHKSNKAIRLSEIKKEIEAAKGIGSVGIIAAVIAGAVSAGSIALGAYNTVEIQKLSSQVNQNTQQLNHILVAIDKMSQVLSQNAMEIDELLERLNEITKNLQKVQVESQLLDLAHHMAAGAHIISNTGGAKRKMKLKIFCYFQSFCSAKCTELTILS